MECHGPKGEGDGLVGHGLATRPVDFLSYQTRSKSDETLVRIIQEGTRFDEMHSWKAELSHEDTWDVLRYIRTLAPYQPNMP